jgi:hypothetical protein
MIGTTLLLAVTLSSCIAAICAETTMGKAGFGYLSILCLCLLILWRARK